MKKLKTSDILAALLLTAIVWCGSATANALIEIGTSQVSNNLSTGVMLTITERVNDRYDLTLGYISKQHFKRCQHPNCEWYIQPQIFFGAELLLRPWSDKLIFGVGPYMFQKADRVGTDTFRIGVSVEYRFNDRFGIRARHFSLAGSGPVLIICRDRDRWVDVSCDTPGNFPAANDWNTGQDSWLRAVLYF